MSDHKLMPEILPDPKPNRTTDSPRLRVNAQLARLLAISTPAALACGGVAPGEEPPSTPTPTPIPSPTPDLMRSGYAVVDPMPPPARCAVAESVSIQHHWESDEEGKLIVIEVGKLPEGFSWKTGEPKVYGGELVASKPGAVWKVRVRPQAAGGTTTYLSVELPLSCQAGDGHLSAQILWKPGEEASSTATLFDKRGW